MKMHPVGLRASPFPRTLDILERRAVLTASAFHLFSTAPDQPPPPLRLAVLVPMAGFWLWFREARFAP